MSPVRDLRDFITQRLTAAAVEIFSVFEQTVVRYEEEIDRQRRLLEITCRKPGGKATGAGIPQQHAGDRETSCGLQIKEEPEEAEPLVVKEEPEEPAVKLEPDTLLVTVTGGEGDRGEAEADGQPLPSSHASVRRFIDRQLTAAAVEIFSVVEQTVERHEEADRGRRRDGDRRPAGRGSPPPYFYREKPPCDEETSSGPPRQEEVQSLQIKDEDACSSRDGESFVLETDDFLATPSDELSESDQVDEQLVSFGCAAAAASSRYVDSASSQNLELMSNDELPFFSLSAAMTSTNPGQSCATCDICGAAFKLISQLQRHRAVHAGEKPQSCPVCGKMFLQMRSLKNHIRNHTGEKPYSCAECGKKFGQKGHLKSHMNIHTGEKPFFCETCGKRFCQKSNLISHSRIHTGEKPYSCEICGRSFTGRGNLLVHLRTHTGEKPYPCEVCGKCFSRQDALSAHMRTHTGHKLHSSKPESETSESSDMS